MNIFLRLAKVRQTLHAKCKQMICSNKGQVVLGGIKHKYIIFKTLAKIVIYYLSEIFVRIKFKLTKLLIVLTFHLFENSKNVFVIS